MSLLRGYADDLKLLDWLQQKIFPVEQKMTTEDIYWGSLLSIDEMLCSGITTCADMYFMMDATAKAGLDAGMRIALAPGLTETGDGAGFARLEGMRSFYETWNGAGGGLVRVMLGPHAEYTTTPLFLEAVAGLAHDLGVEVHIHVAESAEEVRGCRERHGLSPVELLHQVGILDGKVLAAHCVYLDEHDMELLKQHDTRVVHNPTSNLKLANGVAPVARLLDLGVTVGLGTDGPASTNRLDLFQESRLASILQKSSVDDASILPARQAFQMATLGGARALGWDDQIGSLVAGKQADMVLLDPGRSDSVWPQYDLYSQIVYAADPRAVAAVWVAGRLVVHDGQVLGVDQHEVRAQVSERARRLTAGDGALA